MLSKPHQSKFTLMKREMGKNRHPGESCKSQRTTRVSLPSAEASLPGSLCPEMCKKGDLKLKQSRQFQSEIAGEIVTRTSEKMLKEVAFALNDKETIIAVSETFTYLIDHQFQKHKKCYLDCTRIVRKSSSAAAESTSEETCLGNRDYDSVLSLIDNDVFAGQ